MICTTLNKIREHGPCEDGWKKLLTHLGKTQADDEPLPLVTVLDSNGLDDCLWCLRTVPENDREWRLFAVWCARKVQHLMTDQRSVDALDVAERYARGEATEDELAAARAAARAARAAWAVGAAAREAARAAVGAAAAREAVGAASREAAWAAALAAVGAAAREAAWAAAWDAAWAAALAAVGAAAGDAAQAAAGAAAREAAWEGQSSELRRILTGD